MPPASAGATAAKVLVCFFVLFYLLNFPLGGAKKTHEQHQKHSYSFFLKKTKQAFACFSAESSSQRASDETHFFNTHMYQQSDYKKPLKRVFGAATTPGR
jgi:hypothetical protein